MANFDDVGMPMGLAPSAVGGIKGGLESAAPGDAVAEDLPMGLSPTPLPETPQQGIRLRQPIEGFAETPEGGVTGLERLPQQRPRVDVSPAVARVGLETVASTHPGVRIARAVPRIAAEVAGAVGGSLLASATFDPVAEPSWEALTSGAFTAGGGTVGALGATLARRLVGRPVREGRELLDYMEGQGIVPPAGAVLGESALITALHSIGRADAVYGHKIESMMAQAAGTLDLEVRRTLADYIRFKRTADRGFAMWDDLRLKHLGDSRTVKVDARTADALEAAAAEYERVGAKHKLDNSLLTVVDLVQELKAKKLDVKDLKLSMREAEAARSLLYAQANLLKNREAGAIASKAVGGQAPSNAVRAIAEDIGRAMDESINIDLDIGRLPVGARKVLENARALWKNYRQGEAIVDELLPKAKTAGLMHQTLNSNDIEGAVQRIQELNARLGRPAVDTLKLANLAKLGRMMATVEKAGQTSAFQYSVRAGQAIALTGAVTGTVPGQTATIALTPPVIAWLMTNEKALNFLFTGMRAEPGTAKAMQAFRQLALLGAKEGVLAPPDREGFQSTPGGAAVPQGFAPPSPGPQPRAASGVDDFQMARYRNTPALQDPMMQAVAGPLEHREAAEDIVRENPLMSIPLAAGIPAWTAGKALGLLKTRSPATMDEMFAGYEGIARGLARR